MTEQVARLTVPASSEWIALVRTAASSIAARLGYDIEGLEDVRIAVGEIAGVLLTGVPPDGLLECEFRPGEAGLLEVSIATGAQRAVLPAENSLAWTVLSAIVDEATVEESEFGMSVRMRITRSVDAHLPA